MSRLAGRLQAVLGMNVRNAGYVFPRNPRKARRYADDKILAKRVLAEAGIPVADTLAVFESRRDVIRLEEIAAGLEEFAVKPARGSGGAGIVLVRGRAGRDFLRGDGSLLPVEELQHHLVDLLTGAFSGGRPDVAFLETLLLPHAELVAMAPRGLPDLRVITLRARPILSMLRLPTSASGGRANLHAGGIGLGVDLATGVTTRGWYRRRRVDEHPDTGAKLGGVRVPFWEELVDIAVRSSKAVPLGYLGVDLTVDARLGPVVLELNARPGLEIQNVTGVPLRQLLEGRG